MQVRNQQGNNGHRAGGIGLGPPNPDSHRKAIPINAKKALSPRDLEGLLSSALLAGDKELGGVVREVDEISKALKSDATDTEALRVAVHPAVWSAVKHVILERELRYLALTDDLTCLYNRRGFFAAATQQLKLALRNSLTMLLFFCDVDNLKKINDSCGHREGDLALVRAADALEASFRGSDILARLGGDEFAVLALQASGQDESAMLRRLEKCLKKSGTDESHCDISLSVGVARFDPQQPLSLAELMEEADRNMYQQKRSRPKLA